MRTVLRNATVVVLALATLASGVLWIDSFRVRGTFDGSGIDMRHIGLRWAQGVDDNIFSANHMVALRTERGELHLIHVNYNDASPKRREWALFGLSYSSGPSFSAPPQSQSRWRELHIPFAGLLPLFAVYPVLATVRGPILRWRRRRRGACTRCGYDLTGNVSGTCPECAQPLAARKTQSLIPSP